MSAAAHDLDDVGPLGQAIALSFRFLLVGAFLTAVGWMVSNVRQVPPDSQAVVVRLGRPVRVQGPGLLIAWPKPVEQVVLVPAAVRQIAFAIPRFTQSVTDSAEAEGFGYGVSADARQNSAFFITGDSSIVHLDARLLYQVTDPVKYMVASAHIKPALQRLFIAAALDTIARRDLDTILVARPEIAARSAEALRRERLRTDLMNAVNARLARLDARKVGLGIAVSRIDLVPSIPSPAKETFDSVLAITQDAERTIAAARTNAEITRQTADREKDRIMTDATARAEENVSIATSATASIAALAQSGHDMSRKMLMTRLYYSRIEPIIKKAGRLLVLSKDSRTPVVLSGAGK